MKAISEREFFRLSTILPVITPIIVGTVVYLITSPDSVAPRAGPVAYAAAVVVYSLPIGLVPYALVVVPTFIWLRDRPTAYYPWAVVALPPVFTAVLCALFAAVKTAPLFEFATYSIVLGYAYVSVTFAARACLARAGCIAIDQPF